MAYACMDKMAQGYAMAAVGFLLLVYGAYGYLSGQYDVSPAITVFGLVAVSIGMATAKKAKA